MSDLKVTIITSIFNNKEFIEEAINSVNEQTYNNIEHIIIDGNSTDGSKDIIKKNMNKKIRFLCENDSGIYDALNKGINMSSGASDVGSVSKLNVLQSGQENHTSSSTAIQDTARSSVQSFGENESDSSFDIPELSDTDDDDIFNEM